MTTSRNTTFPFDTPGNYTFDSGKAEVSGGSGRLKLVANPNNLKTISGSDLVLGSQLQESGGIVSQRDQKPASLAFFADFYNNTAETNYGNGTVAAPITGAGDVTGNRANLDKGSFTYMSFNPDNIQANANQGAVYVRVIPQFNGTPSVPQQFFHAGLAIDGSNRFIIQGNASAGQELAFIFFDSNGDRPVDERVPFTFVSGSALEVFMRWDLNAKTFEAWVNGTKVLDQSGIPNGTFDAIADTIRSGSNTSGTNTHIANYKLDKVAMWESNSITLTEAQALSIYRYQEGSGTSQATGTQVISDLNAITETASGSVRYTINDQYWNGASWVASNGSYTQANDQATINANLVTLTLPASFPIPFRAVFQQSQTVSSTFTQAVLDFDTEFYETDNPSIATQAIRTDLIESVSFDSIIPTGDDITWALLVNGVQYIYQNNSWVVSSSAMALDASVDFSALALGKGANIALIFFLQGQVDSTPQIQEAILTYDFAPPEFTAVPKCCVYGRIQQPCVEEGATELMRITLSTGFWSEETHFRPQVCEVATDSAGCWEIELPITATLTGTPSFNFTRVTQQTVNGRVSETTVDLGDYAIPDQQDCDLNDLANP